MNYSLSPTDVALISRDLLDHPDPDVKLAVTSCLTEVTRLCAPHPPYGDDIMKEIFQRIVDTFANLDDINSPSYARRLSILNSFSRVNCSVLMLDLDLDHLILDIFHHFFKTASTNHSENVIEWMEHILMVIIEESDNVRADLASCLLQYLTKEAQETFPASFDLAERVLGLCKDRLKVVFVQLLRGTPLYNYSNVVILLCQDASGSATDNNADAYITDMEGEDKISGGSVSEESPQETSKIGQDDCRGQNGTHPSIASTSAISNGSSLDNPASSEQKPELSSSDGHAKTDELISVDKEPLESVTTETEKLSDGHKLDSSPETGFEVTEHPKVVKVNGSVAASEELSPETDDIDNEQLIETGEKGADGSSNPIGTKPAVIKRRGRPPKSQEKKQVSDLKSGKVDQVCNSGGRRTRRLIKDDAKPPSTKAVDGESVKKQHIDKDTDQDTGLKEMMSTTKSDKTKGQQEDNGVSKRKRLQEAEEAPPSKKNKMLDENLVGSRIKVWWSDDKMFYTGVIKSFNASSKKHKVAYDDGDVEVLLLKKEKWELIDDEQGSDHDLASDMPRGRRGQGSSSQGVKTETPQSGNRDSPKKRGRPKAARSSNNVSSTDGLASLKGKGAEDAEGTPKTSGNVKKVSPRLTRSAAKAKYDVVKKVSPRLTRSAAKAKYDVVKASNKD
ncbi:hypothetical protein EJB05_38850 [Eragrostis curvula]|uniref:Tudor domain-containing protein n=1 Tax=Eragrostis curvula TaxID=38414 RepID=A0A5J9TVF9_9POAL|nr:hypothetical protein EJB05_38850 [Eragrostis curvula]